MKQMNAFVFAFAAAAIVAKAIPVYLMLPLDTVGWDGLKDPGQMRKDLEQIRNGGLEGVMTDVWWGVVENEGPGSYNWTGYRELVDMVKDVGLKLQVVMSFHKCGGNVGDTCDFPLPSWIPREADFFYTDREGRWNDEYISLGMDNREVYGGRTALEMYKDYMLAFAKEFDDVLGNVIDGVSVGMGPASELRYPSYPNDRWSYCGVGEFQCYDKNMLEMLAEAASDAGHPEWGSSGPSNAGEYNSRPQNTEFFTEGGFDNFASDYGKFFLSWYFEELVRHGEAVIKVADAAFGDSVQLNFKVSGIHWWYDHVSHAAELTAGYHNANGNDPYYTIAKRLGKYAKAFDFTCMEMVDSSNECASKPATMVANTISSVTGAGMEIEGENALELCNPNCYEGGFNQIYTQATSNGSIFRFTYLRLTRDLLDNSNNWGIFTNFVSRMASA